jgi:hypothetical protein
MAVREWITRYAEVTAIPAVYMDRHSRQPGNLTQSHRAERRSDARGRRSSAWLCGLVGGIYSGHAGSAATPFSRAAFRYPCPVGWAAMMPWAFNIGGRWTPVLTWWGSGRLVTKSGIEYPMFVLLYPSAHFSRLRQDGRSPTGGCKGTPASARHRV